MMIHIVAVGSKMPSWVNTAFQDYAKRLQHDCRLQLIEVALAKRDKQSEQNRARALAKEAQAIEKALPKNAYQIHLEVTGKHYSSEHLAQRLQVWQQLGQNIAIIIGGPDGIPTSLRQQANEQWSLSALTLPHPLVRVVLAEALYRAWSINQGHPYHRAD